MWLNRILNSEIRFRKPKTENHRLRKLFKGKAFDLLFREIVFVEKTRRDTNQILNQDGRIKKNCHIQTIEKNSDQQLPDKETVIIDLEKIFREIEEESDFNPKIAHSVNTIDLEKIFKWMVQNPETLNKPWITKKYVFFIYSDIWIEEELKAFFWPPSIKTLDTCQWFVQISLTTTSMIVIPWKWLIEFDYIRKRKMYTRLDWSIWEKWNPRFDIEKNFSNKVFRTNIWTNDMINIFTKIYWK